MKYTKEEIEIAENWLAHIDKQIEELKTTKRTLQEFIYHIKTVKD